ncbi:hypothetical protein KR009_011924 [Drosophila setifemur]|nr:hypothetical protein KR009_011924 [Drosophila setifemur]
MHNGRGNSGWNNSGNFYSGDQSNHQRHGAGGGGGPGAGRNNNHQSNGNWSDRGQRHSGGQRNHNNSNGHLQGLDREESFSKFRDPNQQLNNDQQGKGGGRRIGRGGGRGMGRRGGRREGGGGWREGGGGRRNKHDSWQDPKENSTSNHMLYYDKVGDVTEEPPLLQIPPAASSPALSVPRHESLPPAILDAPSPEKPVVGEKTTLPLINIKKEKGLEKPKQETKVVIKKESKPQQKAESSSSSSSSEEESEPEPGQVMGSTKPKTPPVKPSPSKPIAVAKKPASSSESSSSDSDSESEEAASVKSKQSGKEKDSGNKSSSRKLKKLPSEEDVVCMGNQERQFTITDEDEDSSEAEDDVKRDKVDKGKNKSKAIDVCGICDRKGHTSFQCQMICRNCSGRFHSLKNCPNPPNLNIAMQAFMEFTMQQMTVFQGEQRFTFPAGAVTAPGPSALIVPAAATKNKKDKKAAGKKAKKTPQKRMKLEPKDEDEDDDDDDDDEEEDDEEEASSESEESESSDEPAVKQKRKRISKSATKKLPTQVFPFPLLGAPGAPYNSMMYPYGTPFSFPK